MDWFPPAFCCFWVFVIGLMVGSFLNVLIARLPYEKSIIWPLSRCFSCYQPIHWSDNLPIIGYLRLRGKCRQCQAPFSSQYLWVEFGTGLAFLALYILEILMNWNGIPEFAKLPMANRALASWKCWAFFAYHAFLLSALIAAAVIDAEHRIIPPLIPYSGMVIGLIGGAVFPWPWPNPASAAADLPADDWYLPHTPEFHIPLGLQPWPYWGPLFKFAPAGSVQLGLLTAVIGALAGSLVVRLIKWLFEVGFGREAMGLGDADLLMMAGAFLGWQVAVLSLFVGAVAALVLKILGLLLGISPVAAPTAAAGPEGERSRELPFGPGLALGVVLTWFGWRWLAPHVQFVFYDMVMMGICVTVMAIGMVAAGLLLRRPEEKPAVVQTK